MLPHLDAAYSLARWLVRDGQQAQDRVQEAYLRAFRYFHRFHGTDARPWLLQIVRHSCYSWLRANRQMSEVLEFRDDEDIHDVGDAGDAFGGNPEALLMRKLRREEVLSAVAALPLPFREVIVLRELEDMSYEGIAQIMDIPVGTVMSRLSRARALLRHALIHTKEGDE
ncbi:RNA polymerase sigma-70 factor, ECF subfamily [Polaromonas sp. OV174]|nr:RNA polymerase sigma-70 factor, ECF subfamily [Polaromonas sp. OV174]